MEKQWKQWQDIILLGSKFIADGNYNHDLKRCSSEEKGKWKTLIRGRLFATPWIHGILQARILERVAFPFFRGIFPTQGSNPGLPHCRLILDQLSHNGSPRILEWAACPFSRGSSQNRNQTRVSCIAGGVFTNWAIREGPLEGKIWQT